MDADLGVEALANIEAHQHDPLAAPIKRETVLALVAEVHALRAERDELLARLTDIEHQRARDGEERDRLRDFASWLVAMDDPESADGLANRQWVTLSNIIDRARVALDRETP